MIERWFSDSEGVYTKHKDPDSEETYTIDAAPWLGRTTAGAQITITETPTWSASGVTIISNSNTTTVLTIKIGKTGTATITLTDSAGDKRVHTYRWKCRDR